VDDFQFFEDVQSLFKNRENFQRIYNTLKEIIRNNIDSPQKLLDLHHNTSLRLLKSFYHLKKIEQLKCNLGKSVSAVELIFIHYEELLSSLQSSLDALAYEINEIYQLNLGKYIDIRKVMDELPESPIRDLLQKEIEPQDKNHWYRRLRNQRNSAIHRPTKLSKAVVQARPDLEKGKFKEDIVAPGTRVFEDSLLYYNQVESLIITAYRHLKGKIAGKEIMHIEDIKGELLSLLKCPYCDTLVAWREKRTVENWPTEEEKKKYEIINYEKQITARCTDGISLLSEGERKLTEEEIKSSIVDLEDTVCILEKLPYDFCPACGAGIVAIHKDGGKNVQEFLKKAGDNIPLDIIEDTLLSIFEESKEAEASLDFQWKVRRYRYYSDKGLKGEEPKRTSEEKEEVYEKRIIDEYKGRKIYNRFGPIKFSMIEFPENRPTKDIQVEWEGSDFEREALFYKDKDKAISFLERLSADVYYDRENFIEAKKLYQKSLEHNPQNGDSWLGLGLIDILEENEKKGINECLKAGEINKRHYFGDIGVAFYERGELDKAKEWLEKDFAEKNTAKAAYNLGIIALKQNDVEQGTNWFQTSLQLDSQYWDSYIVLGLLYEDAGKIDKAIKILEKGMEQIIDRTEEGKFFYKDEEKAKKMHSLLKKLEKERGKQ